MLFGGGSVGLPRLGVVGFLAREQRPDHASVLVSDGDQTFLEARTCLQLDHPLLYSGLAFRRTAHRLFERGAGPLGEERAQVGVAAPGDGAQACLTPAGKLPRREPEPRGELAPVAEFARVATVATAASALVGPTPQSSRRRLVAGSARHARPIAGVTGSAPI